MADTMQFDLVSPEKSLVSFPVREVRMPGTDGDLTVMPGHCPVIVTLRPGMVTVVDAQGSATEFAVSGGFAEVNNDSISLLAERGHARGDMTQAIFDDMMRGAHRRKKAVEAKADSVGAEVVTAAAKMLADMQALGTHIGLDPNNSTVPD